MKALLLSIAIAICSSANAQLTTLFQADFSNPSSYTTTNNGGGDWIITSSAPQGANSQFMGAMNSATPFEYALFDSDFLGGVSQDATLTMNDMIDASGFTYIYVCFESYYKQGPGHCSLDVSTDGGFTWTTYQVHDTLSLPPGDSTANPSAQLVDISGAAASSPSTISLRFNYTGSPGYAWMVDNLCLMASNTSTAGFEHLTDENSFAVYPNPTKGTFTADLSALKEPTEIRITDLQGRVLLSKNVNPSLQSIDLELDEAPGSYFVIVMHAEGQSTTAIMRE